MAIEFYVAQNLVNVSTIPRGLTARIAGFHPAGPGSTPGVGIRIFFISNRSTTLLYNKNVRNLNRVIIDYLHESNVKAFHLLF